MALIAIRSTKLNSVNKKRIIPMGYPFYHKI